MEWPLKSINKLEVFRGKKRTVVRSAVIGSLVCGTIGTLVMVSQVYNNVGSSGCDPLSDTACVLVGTGIGLVGGGIIGALAGLVIKRDKWVKVNPNQLVVELGSAEVQGLGISLTYSF